MEAHHHQLLKPELPKKHVWVEQDEEDDNGEEEVGVGLVARHSRHANNGVGATLTADGEPEPEPEPVSAPTNGTTSELSDEEQQGGKEEEADESQRNEELSNESGEGNGVTNSVYFDRLQGIWKCRHCNWTHQIGSPCILDVQNPKGYLQMAMSTQTLDQSEPCFTLDTKGTESINGVSQMHSEIMESLSMEINHQLVKNVEDQNGFGLSSAPVEQLHEETYASLKHFGNATEVDANVDIIGEFEENLMELDVERVLEKQNTHDLYCPNCHSCITRRVILRRRKPKVPSIRPKPKRVKKLDPIPSSVPDAHGDTPEIDSDVSPAPAPGLQDNSTEQREAFSCLSCFSFFIPIGNGCFKIFQIFRHAEQNENTPSPQEISQRDNTQSLQETSQQGNKQSPQEINQNQNTQSPQKIGQNENREIPRGISQNENRESSQNLSHNGKTQGSQKRSHEENAHGAQHISQNGDAQSPRHISGNEDIRSSPTISCSENRESPQNINQNESKQSSQKILTAKRNWILSIFAFRKGQTTFDKAGHPTSVLGAAVPTLSVITGEHVDDEVIKPKEPGISDIFSSKGSSLLDNVKAESREKKPDAGMLKRNADAGDDEIDDLEVGLLEPTISSRTELVPLTQSQTQNERATVDAGEAREWDILKSIVYGGLIESITSLGIVSSAAGAGADTLNVLALGVANLIGGLILISHNLRELKNDQPRVTSTETNVEEDRYQALLGRRQNFVLHFVVAVLSFLVFGLVPPVVYGFSYRKSDDKDLKLAAVAGASFVCIFLLALGKGHVRKPLRTYFRTVSYYITLGITASGISYVIGELIKKLLEKLGLFDSSSAVSVPFLETIPSEVGRAFY